ncbi:hypothetical protein [Halomonas sp. Y3]|uniref:hypothetical protein n=1 Tax=Halomonas sp. Y3 TaxID=2956797 RepID=UPI00209D4096|nr:hypothetical protein [Halomonas sp. Y3]
MQGWMMVGALALLLGAGAYTGGGSRMQAAETMADDIKVIIDGDPGTRFTATLNLLRDEGEVVHRLEEEVPYRLGLSGHGIDIAVRQTSARGALSVEVRKGGNVSRSRTQGPGSEIRLRLR